MTKIKTALNKVKKAKDSKSFNKAKLSKSLTNKEPEQLIKKDFS